ncbi:MAG: GGDEF domain-containing protein [Acidimicrobiales bacterium]|nr:GGDEF domain-containing protein [Acidimicrobiales bacterium]
MADDAEWLTALLRCMPGAAMILEGQEIKAVNNDLPQLFGIPRLRITGSPLVDLILPEQQDGLRTCIDALEGSALYSVRLASSFMPLSFTMRRISDRLVVVSARSTETEHQLSAAARGALTHDAVTGLANRYVVLEELHRRLHRGSVQPMAIIAVWVDDLGAVVESSGHRAAEHVCRQVAERLSTRLRGSDMLGRIDDHAFLAVLVSDSDLDELTAVADRLRDEVSFPVEFNSTLVSFTASVLVASIGTKPPSVERIVARLEAAGQKAAATGGNCTDILKL